MPRRSCTDSGSRDRCPGKSIEMLPDCIRDEVRKARACMQLNLVRGVKNNKDKNGEIVATGEEKAEVLNNLFSSVFTGNLSPNISQIKTPRGVDGLIQDDLMLPALWNQISVAQL